MPIEGINTVLFDKFTAFASERVAARSGKSIARLTEGGAMHTITAADPRNDSIGKWRRRNDECTLNDQIRTLFRQAVADLFGGETRIPESVKKAMLLKDYGHGKPLSAHRIDVVRQAVERHFDAFPAAYVNIPDHWERETFQMPDDDELLLDWSRVGSDRLPVISHGLCDSSK